MHFFDIELPSNRERVVKEWPEARAFCTCSLPNVFRATTACVHFAASNCHRILKEWSESDAFCTCSLPDVLRSLAACTSSTSNCNRILKEWSEANAFCTCSLPGVLRSLAACTSSTLNCNRIVKEWSEADVFCTPQNWLKSCTFDLEMCFPPQQRTIFRHLDNFWTSVHGPKTGNFHIFTFKCASLHNGVHFSRSQLAKVLRP